METAVDVGDGVVSSHHVCADEASRRAKAAKIRRLIETRVPLHGATVLDIGAGSGVIASSLAQAVGSNGSVTSVDVIDARTVRDGYTFHRIDSVSLPFDNNTFDVVISNHVIEHVGGRDEQRLHLAEIARVLRLAGLAYIATPNRRWIMEPHFRLPFLAWLPRRLQDTYVRVAGRAARYDCRLLTKGELRELVSPTDLVLAEVTAEAITVLTDTERDARARLFSRLPPPLRRSLLALAPTMVFLLSPQPPDERKVSQGSDAKRANIGTYRSHG